MCSLCLEIPIVTSDYWNKYLKAVKEKTALPKAEDYFPQIQDPDIKEEHFSLSPKEKEKRKRIFHNKIFVFTSFEHYVDYKDVIECAGK